MTTHTYFDVAKVGVEEKKEEKIDQVEEKDVAMQEEERKQNEEKHKE